MSIESGRYIITHAQHWNLAFLSDANDGTSLLGCLEQDLPGEEWNVKELRNGRYAIVNFGHKMSASAVFQAQKGEHVVGRETGSVWLIKEHGSEGKYTIATANDKLRWWLDDSWPETPITLHDAPPSDPRCLWSFQKVSRMNTASSEVAREEVVVARAELARKVAEVEVAKQEAARSNAGMSRKTEELEATKRELALAKSEVVRTLGELDVARQEATAAKAVATENAARRKEIQVEASMKAAEVEKAKREAGHAKEEVAKYKASFRSYVKMASQLHTSRITVTNVLDNEQPRPIQAALFWAAENGDDAVVPLLLEQEGMDINYKNKSGFTALALAAWNGHVAVVRLLLAHEGVDVNSKRTDGTTPLFLAAQKSYDAVVRLLLVQDGVDVNSKDTDGWTPLYVAARYGHDAVVRLLLVQEGIDVNAMRKDGRTPLMCAEKYEQGTVARLLREKISQMGNRAQPELI